MQPKISRQVGIAVLLICRCSTIGLGETFEERQDDREPPPPPSHSQANRMAELRMTALLLRRPYYGWTAFKPR
jgi:hypothetical protein